MSGDFNQIGQQYEFAAFAGPPSDHGVLARESTKAIADLQRAISQEWGKAEEERRPELTRYAACLECLASFLFQCSRMRLHWNELAKLKPNVGEMAAFSGVESLTDFEALLYLARSCLDRLTFAIAKQTHKQECDKFKKMSDILKNFERKDPRAKLAKTAVDVSLPHFEGLLLEAPSGKTSLRSLLAHSRSTGESLTGSFIVHRLNQSELIRFDLEVERYPVLLSAHELNCYVPFVVINVISAYFGGDAKVTFSDCEPSWLPKCAPYSRYISKSETGLVFTNVIPNPDGFTLANNHFDKKVLRYVEKVSG